ncbi:SDR family oxidoreductase [Kerstersia gyiorum]|uniref:NAD(P)-dependent dehydrogenase (Short-subunit alcohol dehydrogenase family) n=1 Tax=Kerstersia gyiorum TaxID=206506 RepID=A0A171KT58_9BURK|nr:SDR family oxidoreductase [Kerstersia gyiorum]MCO7639552.1 SDR family oxidoreductase [Pseudomonas sp. S 311-6]KAB0543066.1 SDR family oxidoreductase [Kerstersia gyiorum]KKO72075.1 short-chain dehydrogenase [Kerstersia gyiorum]MCP1634695.1 NAD(P)-dependent dehydrogenase (short-subunit alcohol dehydrogenase family) [Kerstersia gyiorum]MCP1635924.1 NAD(P)-dependent dehydrogenase (short-subunit alcohol dehydrogenase family) [Kerstersia gyiorum]
MKLQGKIIIVTGAGSGIGEASAGLMAEEGAHLCVVDRSAAAAQRVAAAIREAGGSADAWEVDVAQAEQVRQAWERIVAQHGRMDVLVNNAGYGMAGTVADTSLDDWTALMRVNVDGVFHGCKYAVPVMQRQGGGVIVNTASVAAMVGLRQRAAYCASKGAVTALTRAMAVDHAADGIRVNCVAPGTIESPYFEQIFAQAEDPAALRRSLEQRQLLGRLGQPGEVARAILFLACDDAAFATGSTLVLDGGLSAA